MHFEFDFNKFDNTFSDQRRMNEFLIDFAASFLGGAGAVVFT